MGIVCKGGSFGVGCELIGVFYSKLWQLLVGYWQATGLATGWLLAGLLHSYCIATALLLAATA